MTARDAALTAEVILHLEAQIESARRLLATILAQGKAIRAQDVEGVVTRLAEIKSEMDHRARLEAERMALLTRAGALLGIDPAGVTLSALTSLMSEPEAEEARRRSAELGGLLNEIAREHGVNRALMRQELSFLDHLMRLVGREPEAGYTPAGAGSAAVATHRALDLQA